jgi:hypothetical protein
MLDDVLRCLTMPYDVLRCLTMSCLALPSMDYVSYFCFAADYVSYFCFAADLIPYFCFSMDFLGSINCFAVELLLSLASLWVIIRFKRFNFSWIWWWFSSWIWWWFSSWICDANVSDGNISDGSYDDNVSYGIYYPMAHPARNHYIRRRINIWMQWGIHVKYVLTSLQHRVSVRCCLHMLGRPFFARVDLFLHGMCSKLPKLRARDVLKIAKTAAQWMPIPNQMCVLRFSLNFLL